jgi:hypothetical protein
VAAMWNSLWRQSDLTFENFRLVGTRKDAKALVKWCLETKPPRTCSRRGNLLWPR